VIGVPLVAAGRRDRPPRREHRSPSGPAAPRRYHDAALDQPADQRVADDGWSRRCAGLISQLDIRMAW
jgi:hypothetical protein